jgi:hypothetical protein
MMGKKKMPKFNKGDRVRVSSTSHSPYRGQTGLVDSNPESFSTTAAGSSGFWYMVRFEWRGLHPAVRFKEEDLEVPTADIIPEVSPAAGPVRTSWWDRVLQPPAMRKYYLLGAIAVVVIAGIVVGIKIGGNHGLPTRPDNTSQPTLTPGLTEQRATTKLAFTANTILTEVKAGFTFPVQPVVQILDADGNIVTDSTAAVTLGVTDRKAILYGTTTVNAVNGVATFTDLDIRTAGYNYSLTAISSGSTSAVSNSFNVIPSPAILLGFSGDPVNSGLELQFTVQVYVMDLFQNVVTDSSVEVTIRLSDDTSASGAVLSGSTTQKAVNGVATFSYLSIDPPNAKYKLTASGPGMISSTSSAFNPSKIVATTATQ